VKLTAAFIGHELRVERRSLRFRAFAIGYLILGSVPAALIHLRRGEIDFVVGAATYAAETLGPLPLLSALLAGLLSLDGVSRERTGGAWTTTTLSGMTNAGYLLRRWAALLALVLPLTAVPLLIAGALAAADGHPVQPAVFLGPWLLRVVPAAAAVSALALGLGTIGGNAASTFLLALLALGLVPAVGNRALEPWHRRFDPPLDWLDVRNASNTVMRIQKAFDRKDPWHWIFPLPETESGFDAGTEAEQELAGGLLMVSLAAAGLGLAVRYLRRTRPDVRPQRVRPDHPLRNFLSTVARLREQYTFDPAPAPADIALIALAFLAAAGAVAAQVERAVHYERLADLRFREESRGGPAPTPPEVVPEGWRIAGSFDPSGRVELRVAGTLRNAQRPGARPRGHLAFALDPGLELAGVGADSGRVRATRAWDRLSVELDPPIPPGGRRTLRFHLAGRPGAPHFALPIWGIGGRLSFVHAYDRHRKRVFSHDWSDLAQSYAVPAVSGLRVELTAPALTPVPRYTPWTLDDDGEPAGETFFPPAHLELSLAVPPGLFVADSCGGVVSGDGKGRGGRLNSRCDLALPELSVVGGRQRLLPGGSGMAAAVFPAHRAAGELHLGFLARSAPMLDEAWPGLGGLGRTVVVEWPADDVHDRRHLSSFLGRYYDPFNALVSVRGSLVFFQEVDLISTRALSPERMVAEIVSVRLSRRRRLDPEQSFFFLQLFRTLALERLGLGPQGGAVVGPLPPERLPSVHHAALTAGGSSYWSDRFPALVAALGKRTGAEPLRAAIEELLARGGERPATFAELAEILTRRSEGPVAPMFRDFFLDGKLPEPSLEDVAFEPAGGGWRVSGKVHNLGDGEALCRVVLTTDLGPVETTVRAGTGEAAPFVLATTHRPQGVFLDPDQECHRLLRMTGTRDRVFFQGSTR
jgi:hypothetical protein